MKDKHQSHSSRLRNVIKYPESDTRKDPHKSSALDVVGMLDRQE